MYVTATAIFCNYKWSGFIISCSETRLVEVIENLCENSEKEVSTESKLSVTVDFVFYLKYFKCDRLHNNIDTFNC